jgi:hypothetical protein
MEMLSMPPKNIFIILILVWATISLAGCQDNPPLTTIQPDASELGDGWEIQDSTHEYDYTSNTNGEAIYGLTVDEYLLVKYVGDEQAFNFFAVRSNDRDQAKTVYDKYVESGLLHGEQIALSQMIGDEALLAETSFSQMNGYALTFRIENVVIELACFSLTQDWIENVGSMVAADLSEMMN